MKKFLRRIYRYLNPISRLGYAKYSIIFPLLVSIFAVSGIHFQFLYITRDADSLGLLAIFIPLAIILYSAFRDGIRGGFIATTVTICYYFYIIYELNYTGEELKSGIESTIILTFLYLLISGIIGWLKQTIDALIIKEADARKRLEIIVEQLPVGVLIAGENGKITMANKQLDKMLGRRIPLGFELGKEAFNPNTTQDGKPIHPTKAPLYLALKTGKKTDGLEYEYKKNDGRVSNLKVSASPIKNKYGKIIAAASIISDITAQKEAEKRKDDFINMASHELKTPLTSMILYLSSLNKRSRGNADKTLINTIKRVQNQTENLKELVDDLLDVSRLNTGKLRYNYEKFEINKLINEVVNALQETTPQKIILTKSKPAEVLGDKFRINQVLMNLISNAIKYSSQEGEIKIHLRINKNEVIISVKDSGIGIKKSELNKIFDRLYQVTDDQEKTFPGLGMGLYISKEIIDKHNGKIWVESEKSKGSTFFFTLPVK